MNTGFKSKLVFDERLQRTIRERDVINLARHHRAELVEAAVEMF